jgi:hypothetical protein
VKRWGGAEEGEFYDFSQTMVDFWLIEVNVYLVLTDVVTGHG